MLDYRRVYDSNKFFSQFRFIHPPIIQHGKGQNHHLGLSTHGDWTAGGCRQGCTYWDPYYMKAKIKSPYFGWWFGNMNFIFPYIGNSNPNWLSYSEGWLNHQPVLVGQKLPFCLGPPWSEVAAGRRVPHRPVLRLADPALLSTIRHWANTTKKGWRIQPLFHVITQEIPTTIHHSENGVILSLNPNNIQKKMML